MRKLTKKDRIMQLTMGILLSVVGVVIAIAALVLPDMLPLLFVTAIMDIGGPLLIVIGVLGMKKLISANEQASRLLSDPSSLAFQTYGGNGGYKHYSAIADKKGQDANLTRSNLLGAATLVGLGAGTFSSGVDYVYVDCFLSDAEIIINNKNKNPGLDDKKFSRFTPSTLCGMLFERDKEYLVVVLVLPEDKRVTLHFSCNATAEQLIRNDFSVIGQQIKTP